MSPTAHSLSHRSLIGTTFSERRALVDAIIVPSARHVAALEEAGRLAEQLGCTLLVICSKHSNARRAVERLARRRELHVIAIEFPDDGIPRFPVLETPSVFDGSRLKRLTDTSAKRNLGLVLAKLVGWERVVFLDDDILVPDATDLERAAALLDNRDGVGLHIGGFPDNSVVCHANRETGAAQDTFIGGGALAVPAQRSDSFFPEIYNEDWFFLLGKWMLRPVGQVGTAIQKEYDPFANPDRARREEFGDVLAEGLFALFDKGRRIDDADEAYWASFLTARRTLIEDIKDRIENKPDQKPHSITTREKAMLESLIAAGGRLQFIQPSHCVDFIDAWQRDRETWRGFMSGVRPVRRVPHGSSAIKVAMERYGPPRPGGPSCRGVGGRRRPGPAPAPRRPGSAARGCRWPCRVLPCEPTRRSPAAQKCWRCNRPRSSPPPPMRTPRCRWRSGRPGCASGWWC